jgi:hypothetical protein
LRILIVLKQHPWNPVTGIIHHKTIKCTKLLEVPFLLCINSLKILQQMEVLQEKITATPSASVKGVYILAVVYKISEFCVISVFTSSPTFKDIMSKIYHTFNT